MAKKKRKLSAYNRHVQREMKAGKSMKAAARSWKSGRKSTKKSKASPKRSKPKARAKTGGRKVAKGFNTQKIFKLVRMAALVAPAAFEALGSGTMQDKAGRIMALYTGYSPTAGRFDAANLMKGYGAFLAATLVTNGIPKLAGLIRGI